MSESEKKVLGNEELEDVNGGTIIDDVMDTMDVMEELGSGFDKSMHKNGWYIRDVKTGVISGPYSSEGVHKRIQRAMQEPGGADRYTVFQISR